MSRRRSHVKRAKILASRNKGIAPSSAATWRQESRWMKPRFHPNFSRRVHKFWMMACQIRSGYPRNT